jgi:regulatory protein
MKGEKRRSALDEVAFMLQYRARSEQEVRKKLEDKGYEPEEAEPAIQKAKEYGWINDSEFARRALDASRSGNIKGARSMKYSLKNKGVPEEVIEACMAEADRDEELEKALKVSAALVAKNRDLEKLKLREKLYRSLAYKGFDYDVIAQAVERSLRDWNEEWDG